MIEFLKVFILIIIPFVDFIQRGMSRSPKGCVIFNAILGMYIVISTPLFGYIYIYIYYSIRILIVVTIDFLDMFDHFSFSNYFYKNHILYCDLFNY
jgi:hypothetical protein